MSAQAESKVETIPFTPILPPNATVLMMGTFPPTKSRRSMEFHYPNFQNDMWRIYGKVFFDDKHHFEVQGEKRYDPKKIRAFLEEKGIALCESVYKAIREKNNASDKYLTVVEKVDLEKILNKLPKCNMIFTTGGKATETLLSIFPEKIKLPPTNESVRVEYMGRDLQIHRMPSTSRAYPLSFDKKAAAYALFFLRAGLL